MEIPQNSIEIKTSRKKNDAHSLKIEGLNSLRFFAFFAVYCYHNIPPTSASDNIIIRVYAEISSYGYLGVDVFFVLSSFLLTYLGIEEKKRTNNFSIKNFLVRRILRIFPLYYLMIFLCFVILPLISSLTSTNISLPEHKLYYLFFLSNYDNDQYIFALKFLWTIAIEEQYYWTWAFCLLLLRKNFALVTIFFLFTYIIAFFTLPKWNIQLPDNPLLYLTNFATGSILAIYYSNKKSQISFSFPLVALLILFVTSWWITRSNIFVAQIFLCSFIAVFILMVNIFCNKPYVRNTFLYKIFEELGKYTYGLYVYSGLVITVFLFAMDKLHFVMPLYLVFLLQLLILIVISKLSYKYYEERFLRLSSKYRQ